MACPKAWAAFQAHNKHTTRYTESLARTFGEKGTTEAEVHVSKHAGPTEVHCTLVPQLIHVSITVV